MQRSHRTQASLGVVAEGPRVAPVKSAAISAVAAFAEILPFGIVLLGPDKTVVAQNAAARRILAAPQGINRPEALTVLVRDLVADFARSLGPRRSLRIHQPAEGSSLFVFALAFEISGEELTALLISETSRDLSSLQPVLERHFALTPSEAKLALTLARGNSIQEAASALDISLHTARSYLKVVFSKIGVGRQSDLVRLITSLIVPLSAHDLATQT